MIWGNLMWIFDNNYNISFQSFILKARGEGDDRGWDGWMASPTRWTWVWVNFWSWWWARRPGVLRFMGSQRVGHDWVTELNWWVIVDFCWNSVSYLYWEIFWRIYVWALGFWDLFGVSPPFLNHSASPARVDSLPSVWLGCSVLIWNSESPPSWCLLLGEFSCLWS